MSLITQPFMRVGNRVVDSPPELLAEYEVTAELKFEPAVDTSNIDLGAIHAAENIWMISLWFKPDALFDSSASTDQYLFGQYVDATNYLVIYLRASDGKLVFDHTEAGGQEIVVSSETSWKPEWQHVICSLHNVNGKRMIVNGGTAVTEAGDTTAISLIANQILGARDNGTSTEGFDGAIKNVAMSITVLSAGDESGLLVGIVPVDATEYYPLNEGTGTIALDYGSGGNNGTIDSANTWEGTGAQASIILSQIPAGYDILILEWENLIVNNAAIQNLQLTMAGGAGEYDYSNLAFGTTSTTQNAANFILLGTCGDVPGVGRKSNGSVKIFNRLANEKVCIGTEVGVATAQTTLHDLFGFHIEAKDRTVDEEISTMTITPAAGSLMGGSRARVIGISTGGR